MTNDETDAMVDGVVARLTPALDALAAAYGYLTDARSRLARARAELNVATGPGRRAADLGDAVRRAREKLSDAVETLAPYMAGAKRRASPAVAEEAGKESHEKALVVDADGVVCVAFESAPELGVGA